MEQGKVRAHVNVRGGVQGVGFRAWTIRQARQRGLHGWVKNCLDGSVEAVFEGARGEVAGMVEVLHEGPRLAEVSEVKVEEGPCSDEFDTFSIEYE